MASRQVTPSTTTRLRRPFRRGPRKPTRAELLGLLRRLYGPGIPRYIGSPYEDTRFDDAEIVLHELGHMTQIEGELPLRSGRARPSWLSMKQYLEALPRPIADRHEIRTIGIVIGVARSLRLPFARYTLVMSGARNSYLCHNPARFDRLVTRAENTPAVHVGVQMVLDILDEAWSGMASFGVGGKHE